MRQFWFHLLLNWLGYIWIESRFIRSSCSLFPLKKPFWITASVVQMGRGVSKSHRFTGEFTGTQPAAWKWKKQPAVFVMFSVPVTVILIIGSQVISGAVLLELLKSRSVVNLKCQVEVNINRNMLVTSQTKCVLISCICHADNIRNGSNW